MRNFTAYILFLMISLCSYAQQPEHKGHEGGPGEKQQFNPEIFKKYMEDFIAKEACLTQQERDKFFPMLNEMFDAQRKIMEQQRELGKNFMKELTEAEYEAQTKKVLELNEQNAKIESTYYKKFSKVLSWKKIALTRRAIGKFHNMALRRFSPNRGGGGPRGDWHKNGKPRGQKQ